MCGDGYDEPAFIEPFAPASGGSQETFGQSSAEQQAYKSDVRSAQLGRAFESPKRQDFCHPLLYPPILIAQAHALS